MGDSKSSDWIRWILNILIGIIVMMAAAWAKEMSDNQKATSKTLQNIDRRMTRIETVMGLKPLRPLVDEEE